MSPASSDKLLRFIIAGCLNRDTILPINGPPQIDVLGGNLAYAAVGLKLWDATAGLLARVGNDFPLDWLDRFNALGFDLSGVKILPEQIEMRRFLAHVDQTTTHFQNPVQHFADRGLPFPPGLLDYRSVSPRVNSRTVPSAHSVQISDVPKAFLDASAVHICPIDYLSHMLLTSLFRQGQATTLTLSPDPGYMTPSFWEEIRGLISEVTAFITTEQEMRSLFQGRQTDLWTMADVLADYGPEIILIRTTALGYYLLDRFNDKRWMIPEYRTNVVDPTGMDDAFAGAFLAGYRVHYDPLEAALMGSITASLVMEGPGVFYALDVLPGLVDARLAVLRELVREI